MSFYYEKVPWEQWIQDRAHVEALCSSLDSLQASCRHLSELLPELEKLTDAQQAAVMPGEALDRLSRFIWNNIASLANLEVAIRARLQRVQSSAGPPTTS